MSHDHAPSAEAVVHKPHVLPVPLYLGVWGGLLVLTALTVAVSYFDFGAFNVIVAMAVATAKASLVVLFFMHLKYDERFNVLVFVSSLAFLSLFFIFTLADTTRRGEVDPLERGTIQVLPALPEAAHHEATPATGEGAPAMSAPAAEHEAAAPADGGTAAPAGETPAGEATAPANEAPADGTPEPPPAGGAGGGGHQPRP